MANIILLAAHTIDAMIEDPVFAQFPCIATPPRKSVKRYKEVLASGCGGCKRSKKKVKVLMKTHKPGPVNYNALKMQIVAMPKAQQAALKELLQCTGLKIQYRDPKTGVERRVI